MFKIYFLSAWRNLKKHKGYAAVNIFGLSIGIACCILIFGYVFHELNYDKYHQNSDRIFRIEFFRSSQIGEYYKNSSPGPVGPRMLEQSALVEKQARMIPPFENSSNVLVESGEKRFFETDIYFADPAITEILHVELLEGSFENALTEPNSVILTKKMATKYFGNKDPIGRQLNIEIDYDYYCPVAREDFTVTAIIDDTPANTHIPVTMLLSISTMRKHLPWIDSYWLDFHSKFHYIKLFDANDKLSVEKQLQPLADEFHEAYNQRTGRSWDRYHFYLQPISNIHMDTNVKYKIRPAGNVYYIKLYGIIALTVLLVGCLNFINISVSIGLKNLKQLGIRKINGARRYHLVIQCYCDAAIYAVIAYGLSFGLIELFIPYFRKLTGISMAVSTLLNPIVLLSMVLLFIVIVLASGSYNAFVLTGCKTTNVIRGTYSVGKKGGLIQKILVIAQFTLIMILMVSSLVMKNQLQYMKGSELGFDREQKIVIPFKTHLGRLRQDYENIKAAFIETKSVQKATVSSGVPGNMSGGYYLKSTEIPDAEQNFFRVLASDCDFIDQFKLKFVAGKGFDSGDDNGYIINETGARLLGFEDPEDAIGYQLHAHYHGLIKPITGVIKDFYYSGMRELVEPMVMDVETSLFNTLTLTVNSKNAGFDISEISSTFNELFPETPFTYSYLSNDFDRLYLNESRIGIIVGVISVTAILIGCVGLLGLVSFFVSGRYREIGIRKVMGSSVKNIVILFSAQYIRLIIYSMFISIPLSWYISNFWLQDFAYRVDLNSIPFVIAGITLMFLSISVVGLRCLRAANNNPVDMLKYDG